MLQPHCCSCLLCHFPCLLFVSSESRGPYRNDQDMCVAAHAASTKIAVFWAIYKHPAALTRSFRSAPGRSAACGTRCHGTASASRHASGRWRVTMTPARGPSSGGTRCCCLLQSLTSGPTEIHLSLCEHTFAAVILFHVDCCSAPPLSF